MSEQAPKRKRLELAPSLRAEAVRKVRNKRRELVSDGQLAEQRKAIEQEQERRTAKRTEDFDASWARSESAKVLESLKDAFAASGIDDSASKEFQGARMAHAKISADIARRPFITDPKERVALESEIRRNVAELERLADNAQATIQHELSGRPKQQGDPRELPMSYEKEGLLDFAKNLHAVRLESLRAEAARLEDLAKTVKPGALTPEILSLEIEIRTLENSFEERVRELEERLSGRPQLEVMSSAERPTPAESRETFKKSIALLLQAHPELENIKQVQFSSADESSRAEALNAVADSVEPSRAASETQLQSSEEPKESAGPTASAVSESPEEEAHRKMTAGDIGLPEEKDELLLTDEVPSEPAPNPAALEEAPVQDVPDAFTAAVGRPRKEKEFQVRSEYAGERAKVEEAGAALAGAEQGHLEKTEQYVSSHSALGRGVRKLFGRERKEFKPAKDEVNQARLARVQSLEDYLAVRLNDKDRKGYSEYEKWKIEDRYRRRFITPEVSAQMNAHQDNLRITRTETLRTKEGDRAERFGEWILSQNQKLDARLGKTGARVVRTIVSASVGSGVALVLGPASWGIAGSIWLTRTVRGLAGMTLGTTLGLTAGAAYGEYANRRGEEITAREQTSAVRTIEDIERKQQVLDAYSPEAIASKRQLIEMGVAAVTGALGSYAAAGYMAHLAGGMPPGNVESALPKESAPPPGVALLPAPEAPAVPPPMEQMPPPQIAPPQPAEIPHLDVQADPGFGVEEMAKRIGEQLHAQHMDPGDYPVGSDIRQLLEASQNPGDPNYINNVVHRLAIAHDYYHADGTSVIVQPDAHMTIGADGQLQIHEGGATVAAPVTGSVTIPTPEAAPIEAPNPDISVPSPAPEIHSISPTEQPGFMPPHSLIEANAAPAGAFASAGAIGIGATVMEGNTVESLRVAANDNARASALESGVKVTTDVEGRNLVDGGSEQEKEAFALKQAKEQPGKAFMFTKKIRSGFLGLASRDAWFMAYAEKPGEESQIFETVNNRDWRAVTFSKPGGAPAPAVEERKAA